MGPVTKLEYESRQERYDEQLQEMGINVSEKDIEEKITILREYRYEQYVKLQDAVYKERGWNKNGCPLISTVGRLGIDYDDVIKIISPYN